VANTVVVSTVTPNMVSEPFVLQAAGIDTPIQYSASTFRELLDATYTLGVFAQSFQVTQRGAGANFSVDVGSGFGSVAGGDIAGQGKYLVNSTGTVNLVTDGAPGSGTRIHRVIARVRDKQSSASYTTYDWTFEVLEDTGSGTPATPVSAISLAYVTIASGQASVLNANITDDRLQAVPVANWYAESNFTTSSVTLIPGNSPAEADWLAYVDPHGLWTVAAPGFFTVPFSGKWDVDFQIIINCGTTSATIEAKMYRNAVADANMIGLNVQAALGGTFNNLLHASRRIDLVAGDKLYFGIYLTATSTLVPTWASADLRSKASLSYVPLR
jgi:hypothetical protein